ncbi:hypothetical protein VTJ04DRAFT_10028 [Mycothermus thermophilus]|uniref:uncharacterized protein n=1 Tax=Humicola insolens TaxID=85995 RepID=UPI0037438588
MGEHIFEHEQRWSTILIADEQVLFYILARCRQLVYERIYISLASACSPSLPRCNMAIHSALTANPRRSACSSNKQR